MNILNILPLEMAQMIYKEYFKETLQQIKIKNCFKTFYTDPNNLYPIKCSCTPTNESAFCHYCVDGTIEYY